MDHLRDMTETDPCFLVLWLCFLYLDLILLAGTVLTYRHSSRKDVTG